MVVQTGEQYRRMHAGIGPDAPPVLIDDGLRQEQETAAGSLQAEVAGRSADPHDPQPEVRACGLADIAAPPDPADLRLRIALKVQRHANAQAIGPGQRLADYH